MEMLEHFTGRYKKDRARMESKLEENNNRWAQKN